MTTKIIPEEQSVLSFTGRNGNQVTLYKVRAKSADPKSRDTYSITSSQDYSSHIGKPVDFEIESAVASVPGVYVLKGKIC